MSIYYCVCDLIIQVRPYYKYNSLNDMNCIEYFTNITPFQLLIQICKGLKSLKDNLLIHGNLTPSNILFDDDNQVKLSDYCKYLLYENHNDDKINENVNLYSLKHYKFNSPEHLNGREITSYSDVWSFGCILYYIYTGNVPFNDNNIGDLYSNMISGKFYPLICKKSDEINGLLSKIFDNNTNENGEANRITIEDVINEITNIEKKVGFSDDNIMILFHIENEKTIDYIIEKVRCQEFIFDHEIIYIVRKENFLLKTISDYNNLLMSVYTPTLKDILMNYIYTFIKVCFLYPSLVEYVLNHMIINNKSIEYVIINGIKKNNTLVITKQNFNSQDVEFLGCVLRRTINIERLDLPCIYILYYYNITIYLANLLNPIIIRFLSEQFRYLASLKSLNLCSNPIQPSGIELFSNNLFYITTLISLNISNDMIGDKGIRSVSYNLSNMKNLKSFDISSNEITDRGLNFFSENVNELEQLEELNLSRIYILLFIIFFNR